MFDNKNTRPVIFINQTVGKLFIELVEDAAKVYSSILYTGLASNCDIDSTSFTKIEAPAYNRKNNFARLFSWLHFSAKAFLYVLVAYSPSVLFIVTNPPLLGLVGLFFRLLRKQKYVVLVYDIYPDLLVGMGKLRNGIISKLWSSMNRVVLQHASLVFTIGEDMAHLLDTSYNLSHTAAGHAIVIPNWCDINKIKPIAKQNNPFAAEHCQVEKITVLYSGNMGNTHDIESILAVACELKNHKKIHFMFIGEGAKSSLVEQTMVKEKLNNISLLPFQPEDVLPLSMATGDIGIVAYQPGTEACIVPSKTYYYMAAGLASLVVSGTETDLSRLLVKNHCGIFLRSGDIEGMKQAILQLAENPELLKKYKESARTTAEKYFSRRNTQQYIDALEQYGLVQE